jgi:hypothetical protein
LKIVCVFALPLIIESWKRPTRLQRNSSSETDLKES